MNYVSESINNVVNFSGSFSTTFSGFICQPVRFNKSLPKHITSSVVNKPNPSADAGETLCTIVKCKNKFYDEWMQCLILFLLVTLSDGYHLFNVDY